MLTLIAIVLCLAVLVLVLGMAMPPLMLMDLLEGAITGLPWLRLLLLVSMLAWLLTQGEGASMAVLGGNFPLGGQ